jgi:hypothetical protein
MIGLSVAGVNNEEPGYFWCYENDTTLWEKVIPENETGNIYILQNYFDSIEDTEEWNKTFRTFRINISTDGNKIKEMHSNTWHDLTYNPIRLDCGMFSGVSIAYTCVVPDTYFRIPHIELRRDVNMLHFAWDDKNENFIIKTDYDYDYVTNEWIDKLKDDTGTDSEYVLCADVSYIPSFYIPQDNTFGDNFPVFKTDDLMIYHNEYIRNQTLNITYCDLTVKNIIPCSNNAIEYEIILRNDRTQIQRIEINCAGAGYTDGIYDLKIPEPENGVQAATGYYIVQNGMVSNIVLTNHGNGYTTAPKIELSNGGGDGAMATAVLFRDDFMNITDLYLRYKKEYLRFYKTVAGFSVNINLNRDYTMDLMRTDNIRKFIDVETEKAINPISDNERVRFEPVFRAKTGTNNHVYFPVNRILYHFYFYKGMESDTITYHYGGNNDENLPTRLHVLGFTDSDVMYKKKRLAKTFCRQSFFNNFNPTQYKMECFNTIFFNIDNFYTNYVLNINNISGNRVNNIVMIGENMNCEFSVFNPLLEKFTNTYKNTVVEYNQTSSSEGFFLYLFGEEYKDLIPSDLYMKMEFNNALTGKRTLFFNRPSTVPVRLDNVFFEQGGVRQYMYSNVIASGVKVKWDNVKKSYMESTPSQIADGDFEVKYFWYPVTDYPIIEFEKGKPSITKDGIPSVNYPNIYWNADEPDKLIMKFYEARVE